MKTPAIALVGDYRTEVFAHRCIPDALRLAARASAADISFTWIHTTEIREVERDLAGYAGIWAVPASPYASTAGALAAIRFAREHKRPFLGTCGGFQHALIEFARNVLGLTEAEHAETCPEGENLVVTRLACSLVETTGELHFSPGSRMHEAYGRETAREGHHCSYGVAPGYRATIEKAGLNFTAFDSAGEIRAFEYGANPFFVGTLFQPERSAAGGEAHPLIAAFVRAVHA